MSDLDARLGSRVLPRVSKPSRYLDPLGAAGAPPEPGVRVGLLLPEPAEAALARPGLDALLGTLAHGLGDAGSIDPVFAPQADLEALLLDQDLPLFGLHARRSLADCALILAWPGQRVQVPMLLRMLERGGIDPDRATRSGPPVVLIGDLALTPALTASYVDAAWAGDPEGLVPGLCRLVGGEGPLTAASLLTLDGVYDPGTGDPVVPHWLPERPPVGGPLLRGALDSRLSGVTLEITRPAGPAPDAPLRPVEVPQLLTEADGLIAGTGAGDLILTGAGAGRHPALRTLLEALNHRLTDHHVAVRLEGIDLHTFDDAVARELAKGRRRAPSFLPLAPSARLREALGRPLSQEDLVSALDRVLRAGWKQVNLAVWAGIPGQTAEDVAAWADAVEQALQHAPRSAAGVRIAFDVYPWVPVSGVDERLAGAPDPAFVEQALVLWKQRARRRKIKVSAIETEAASWEAKLFRGDSAWAPVLREVARRPPAAEGNGFDADVWEQAWRAAGSPGEGPVPAVRSEGTRSAPLNGFVPPAAEGFIPVSVGTGRRARRAGRGEPRKAERYRVRYRKTEPLRFTSHLETTRAFERAARRAQLPVAWSQGKDRRPKLAFGPPLPLGMTSDSEYLDISFAREVPESFVQTLNRALPVGLAVDEAAPIRTDPASLNSAIQLGSYEVMFSDALIQESLGSLDIDELRRRLEQRTSELLRSDRLPVTKVRGEERKTFNARPSLLGLEVCGAVHERPAIAMKLSLGRPDSARPEALTAAIVNWATIDERLLRIHRSGLAIPGRKNDLDPLEVVASGFAWWKQSVRGGTVV